MCECRELKPGDINNYAYGYQDYLDLGTVKVTEPRLPDDETYMSGWFSGKHWEAEEKVNSKTRLSILATKPRVYYALLKEWNEWREAHNLPKADSLPI
jgi:hypothetical protein